MFFQQLLMILVVGVTSMQNVVKKAVSVKKVMLEADIFVNEVDIFIYSKFVYNYFDIKY